MDLKQYFNILWKWAWLIALAAIVAIASSYWASSRMTRLYKTSTTLMVGQFIQSTNPQAQDFYTSQQLAQTYVQLVHREPILDATVKALNTSIPWQALAAQVSAIPIAGT